MREGPTSRVTVADRPYGEFYDFYSVSPEHVGSTLVYYLVILSNTCILVVRLHISNIISRNYYFF
jgi:hypothetical protein